jgi:hypothetical protein
MYTMDEHEAFEAMTRFLCEFYERTGGNRTGGDMRTLLSDIHTEADGKASDPAAWEDWMRCVRSVKERNG